MKRKPTPGRREHRKSGVAVCAAGLREQLERADGERTLRRGDHPRASVTRIDLLSDAELDAYRAQYGKAAEAALARFDTLDETMARELAAAGLSEEALEQRVPVRPILAVFVCLECGASDVALASRSWTIDRAMRRTGMAERDLLAVEGLLVAAWDDLAPPVDDFSPDALTELLAAARGDAKRHVVRTRTVEMLGPRGTHLAEALPAINELYAGDDESG